MIGQSQENRSPGRNSDKSVEFIKDRRSGGENQKMKPLVAPSFYSDPEVFKKEQVILFQNQWNFVGFTTNLENHNDYICKEIGGKSVVIQNFHGELRAFDNVCTHRFSRIRQEAQGNGPLQCPYHGWIFNCEGIPVTIPLQPKFNNMPDSEKESFKLGEWLIETCGVFIFIKKVDDKVTLKNFLGGMYNHLLDFSEAMGEKVDYQEIIIKANWKIILENTLDSYHIWAVHPNSLGKYGAIEGYYWMDEPHSIYLSKAKKVDQKVRKFVSTFSEARKLPVDGYQHYLVFPLLTMSTLFGMSLNVHSLSPISPTETKVTNYAFMGKLNDSTLEQILLKMSRQASGDLVKTVWDEDKPICEQVQLGISSLDDLGGILSSDEQRVYEFQKTYVNLMNS